jgi:manganese transport protein
MNRKQAHIRHTPKLGALEILKYIGPGFIVTVGFIDPGNWAANVAAGSIYGYNLLWMVTLSTIMLIFLQHNAAHLGIVTGLCLSEASTKFLGKWVSRVLLVSAVFAAISTALAEILGAAIGLNMLFGIPLVIGSILTSILVIWMLISNSYRKLEKWIIGFVSIIGLSFLFELTLVNIEWGKAITGWIVPSIPNNSILIIMSVLGAVVMPHNIFLHSEIIQSRQWNLENESVIKKQLKFEFLDTLFSMVIGWAINSAMILVAAGIFFKNNINVAELGQANTLLTPLLGTASSVVFAIALLFAGLSSGITSGMAGGSIFAGIFSEPYDIKDRHSRTGVIITLLTALIIIFFINDTFTGLLISQMLLSIQLPITIFLLVYLTSSKRVMNKYVNSIFDKIILLIIGSIVTVLNILLFISFFKK